MSDFLPNIKHFVYLMLENRSFDNLMGWLYEHDAPTQIIDGPATSGQRFMGLEPSTYWNCFDDDPTRHYVQRGTASMNTPDPDPHEPFLHVNKQIYGADLPVCGFRNCVPDPPEPCADMSGFLADYATARRGIAAPYADDCGWSGLVAWLARRLTKPISRQQALAILATFAPEQIPVITTLARSYAVSDRWFSSVPTQTNTNRAFSTCGTSNGLTDNKGLLKGFLPDPFLLQTVWRTLYENGHCSPSEWMVYYQAKVFGRVFSERAFDIPDAQDHVAPIDDFLAAARAGNLPRFSYVEPLWLDRTNGNSYHPPAQVGPGEDFLNCLFQAVTANEQQWNETLLMVTFDEHGGTYDHVPPPTGATPPGPTGKQRHAPYGQYGFGFDRFGVRVPTILASPWIDERTVFRSAGAVPYDHTSMLKTVLKWFDVDEAHWKLGRRVADAPTFEGVLTRQSPRTDVPVLRDGPPCTETPAPSAG